MNSWRREMRSSSAVLLIAMAALFLGSSGPRVQGQAPRSGPATAPVGNAANGKKLYNSIGCWECHGYSGQGGDGARLAPNPLPFPAFRKYVRAPADQMPPYATKAVSDVQLADIYAFLKTIPRSRDSKDVPLLNQKEN